MLGLANDPVVKETLPSPLSVSHEHESTTQPPKQTQVEGTGNKSFSVTDSIENEANIYLLRQVSSLSSLTARCNYLCDGSGGGDISGISANQYSSLFLAANNRKMAYRTSAANQTLPIIESVHPNFGVQPFAFEAYAGRAQQRTEDRPASVAKPSDNKKDGNSSAVRSVPPYQSGTALGYISTSNASKPYVHVHPPARRIRMGELHAVIAYWTFYELQKKVVGQTQQQSMAMGYMTMPGSSSGMPGVFPPGRFVPTDLSLAFQKAQQELQMHQIAIHLHKEENRKSVGNTNRRGGLKPPKPSSPSRQVSRAAGARILGVDTSPMTESHSIQASASTAAPTHERPVGFSLRPTIGTDIECEREKEREKPGEKIQPNTLVPHPFAQLAPERGEHSLMPVSIQDFVPPGDIPDDSKQQGMTEPLKPNARKEKTSNASGI